jgi:hypothetical protein
MYSDGFIDTLQYENLRKEIDVDLKNIHLADLRLEELRINEVLLECPLFSTLSKPEASNIKNRSIERTFSKDASILRYEGEVNSVFVLLSGSVREQF